MRIKLLMLTLAVACTFAGNARALTKVEYKTQKDVIASDYKANRGKCSVLKANAKDICMSEAKGIENVAKAELTAQYEPSVKHTQKLGMARADAAYDTAKERCDDLSGNAKDVCIKDAKVAYVKAKEDAKVARASADTTNTKAQKMATVIKEANEEKREAQYKAAKERCDIFAGAVKDTCQNDAKAKFGMK